MTKAIKSFFARFILGFLVTVVLLSGAAVVMTGCATMKENSAATELVISQAVMRYIEEAQPAAREGRAQRIIDVVREVEKFASGDEVFIAQFVNVALAALPSDLSTPDRTLAVSLVNILGKALRDKLGEGFLKPDDLVVAREVLATARFYAAMYTEK